MRAASVLKASLASCRPEHESRPGRRNDNEKRQLSRDRPHHYYCYLLLLDVQSLNAQPVSRRVLMIVGQNAPELEQFAASALCRYWNKLFDVETRPNPSGHLS